MLLPELGWADLRPDAHSAVEQAQARGETKARYTAGSFEYEVDLLKHVQTNLKTGTSRPLRAPGKAGAARSKLAHGDGSAVDIGAWQVETDKGWANFDEDMNWVEIWGSEKSCERIFQAGCELPTAVAVGILQPWQTAVASSHPDLVR